MASNNQSVHTGRQVAVAAAIAIVVFAAFSPALRGQFVAWDDFQNFVVNRDFRGLGVEQLRWAWRTTLLGHYVPLTWMSLGLDYVMWGMNPLGYHLTSLVLHVTNALLVYAIVGRLLGEQRDRRQLDSRAVAAIAALLYAVHPLRVESVAWITERRDVLSLFFVLIATLAYTRHAQGDGRRGLFWAVLAFAAALLSKASAVTLPAVFLLLNWYPLRRIGGEHGWWTASARRVYGELLPLFAMSASISILSIAALDPGPQLASAQKIAVSAYSVAFYLLKTAVPAGLAPLYPMPEIVDPTALRYVLGYAVTIGCIAIIWVSRRTRPAFAAGGIAFFLLLFPFLGVVQNGPQIAADRYTYLAGMPLAILAALAISRMPRKAAIAVSLCAIALLSAATWRQSHVWLNTERVWTRVLEVDSTSHYAHNNLGTALAERGETMRAIDHYRRAIALKPSYPDPYNNLGFELAQMGNVDEAITAYREAIRLKPAFADAEVNLGNALAMQGKYDEGIVHYRRAIALMPQNAGAHFNWGLALYEARRYEEAKGPLERAMQLDSTLDDARALYRDVIAAEQALAAGGGT